MALEDYKKKRNFSKTPEPEGKQHAGQKFSFVIQKHAARRLHYDFRLELDGVLLSWAVPKGPSLDPLEKRLAVHVEDHPMEYADFEGVIPEGEYGGGTVVVWDRGTWIPHSEPHESYKKGRMGFDLEGEKLKGGFTLFRMHGRKDRDKADNWLLVKKKDEHAKPTKEGDVLVDQPKSVISGQSVEEIAEKKERVWHSNRGALPESVQPDALSPELATLVETPPEGPEWIYEIKLDGYRALAFIDGGKTRMISRTGKDWTEPLKAIAGALANLPAKNAILDGEVVSLAESGVSDFQRLQTAFGEGRAHELYYYAFDLLFLDGKDLREQPLLERKAALKNLLRRVGKESRIRFSEHFEGSGAQVLAKACALGIEGIVAKRKDSLYQSKRSRDWLKIKCTQRQEFVIGGYTDPEGSRSGIGALLIGRRDPEDPETLLYAGKVGTGFTHEMLLDLKDKLSKLARKTTPFDKGGPTKKKTVHWVEPELVAEIAFSEFTDEGILRHPAFLGLRSAVPRAQAAAVKKPALGIKLTNPDRVYWEGVTKQRLAEYYATIAEWMLPHVARRPLMLLRDPHGSRKQRFFQKHLMAGMPSSFKIFELDQGTENKNAIYVEEPDGLVALAQMGALELHTWGSRIDDVEHPDLLVFDLDPDEKIPFSRVRDAAKEVRDLLVQLGVKSFVKTTGGKGLHVVAPVVPQIDWERAKTITGAIAQAMSQRDPKKYLAVMTKSKRAGKIFVDYFRNGRGATFIAPYSTRAREKPTVAMPVSWEELDQIEAANIFTIFDIEARMKALGADPWAEMSSLKQKLKLPTGTVAA